ncbi:DMT family transporter [Microbacterium sp.]|uniref:DMT family transporter n=1 Tax=Microbacterium sp. TaxID=51671 RepID=UPI0039E7225D
MPTAILFLVLGVLWGASFLLIKVGLRGLTPAQVGLLRLALGALTLTAVMLVTRRAWPREPRLLGNLAVTAVLLFAIPVALYSWAGQFLPSGVSAILNAATPLMTLLVSAVALRGERLRSVQVWGILIGAAGIVLVVSPWQGARAGETVSGLHWPAVMACLLATLSYGCAYTWMRTLLHSPAAKRGTLDPLSLTTVQLLIATLLSAAVAPWTGALEAPRSVDAMIVTAMLILGVFSTGIGYLWNTSITASWGPVRASQVTYLTPVVGVALGAFILAEPVDVLQLIGTAVVLVGILLTQRPHTQSRHSSELTSTTVS